MTDIEKKAHDLAIAFVMCNNQITSAQDDSAFLSLNKFVSDYFEAYNRILEQLKEDFQ